MASPCRKCGATKTESVYHGTLYSLSKKFGYRLRVCSRCRRFRLLHLDEHPDAPVGRDVSRKFELPPTEIGRRVHCPRCGSLDYQRSKRRWHERLYRRSPMARCQRCRNRFPLSSA